jgi:bacterioferritin (cytochrome b1)
MDDEKRIINMAMEKTTLLALNIALTTIQSHEKAVAIELLQALITDTERAIKALETAKEKA